MGFGAAPHGSSPYGARIIVTGITFIEGGKGNVIVHTNLGDIVFEVVGGITSIEEFGGMLVEQFGAGRFVIDIPSGYITILEEPATGSIVVQTSEGEIEMQQIGGVVTTEKPTAQIDINPNRGEVFFDVPTGTFIKTRN